MQAKECYAATVEILGVSKVVSEHTEKLEIGIREAIKSGEFEYRMPMPNSNAILEAVKEIEKRYRQQGFICYTYEEDKGYCRKQVVLYISWRDSNER